MSVNMVLTPFSLREPRTSLRTLRGVCLLGVCAGLLFESW